MIALLLLLLGRFKMIVWTLVAVTLLSFRLDSTTNNTCITVFIFKGVGREDCQ